MGQQDVKLSQPAAPVEPKTTAFSNGIRLTGREWLAVGLFTALFVLFASPLWKKAEPLSVEPDQRIPYDLRYDYWLYERYANLAADQYETLIIGDSVVWGDYVARQETLSHCLNERSGQQRYANLGLPGANPLALAGLVEHYAGSVSNKNVVLQCNPLWLTSPEADLQDDKKPEFIQHPRLVPQFVPKIPAYKEEVSPRIGVVVEQHVPLNSWTTHLQQAYYAQTDIPSWTLEHPYDDPLKPLTHALSLADDSRRHDPDRPWYEGIPKQDYPWVDPDTSLQWHAFQRVVEILQQRGNRVFVLVGPFNEHMLSEDSLHRYQQVKATITAWLEAQDISHLAPEPLPSKWYGDASHPLRAGYAELAGRLQAEPFFQSSSAPTMAKRSR
jgi:hypothetical protein